MKKTYSERDVIKIRDMSGDDAYKVLKNCAKQNGKITITLLKKSIKEYFEE